MMIWFESKAEKELEKQAFGDGSAVAEEASQTLLADGVSAEGEHCRKSDRCLD